MRLLTGKCQVIGTGSEVSVLDPLALTRFAEAERPTWIVNCSGFTAVDAAEAQPGEALLLNQDAPHHLAQVASDHGARLTHFSTDYVFGGGEEVWRPIQESAAPSPLNVYGTTKLSGEKAVLAVSPEHQVIRSAWLFGPSRKNFVTVMLGLFADPDKTVRVVHDQRGSPTCTDDLARGALELYLRAPGGLYHLTNTGNASWYELALEVKFLAEELGFPVHAEGLRPCTTEDFPRPAKRPSYSVLSSSKAQACLNTALPSWQNALASYLTAMRAEHTGNVPSPAR